jgi:hypothetical protein
VISGTLYVDGLYFQNLDYHFYSALALAEPREWRARLVTHSEQLGEWAAKTGSPAFRHKYALVSAEIARLNGRELDAMRQYEDAIRLAREHGFLQDEALAYELATRFCAATSFETTGEAFLLASATGVDVLARQSAQCTAC